MTTTNQETRTNTKPRPLGIIGGLNAMAAMQTRTSTCQLHGQYESREFLRGRWSQCPSCTTIALKEREVRESEERLRAAMQLWQVTLNRSEIPLRFQDRTLESFVAKNEGQQNALHEAQNFAKNFRGTKGRSMIFCGNPGTGKTHLACGIALAVMREQAQRVVLYTTVMKMIRHLKESWKRDSTKTEEETIKGYIKPELLIIDEIGMQYGSETEKLTLFEILNGRYENLKPTILISNFDKAGVKEYLGERLFDRLREDGSALVNFGWTSYR
jgi:DNA replication protein DnaC